jgi:hypothetical protein
VFLGEVARMHAGTLWILHERDKRSDLMNGKAKLAAAANEGQSLDIDIAIYALAACLTFCRAQQTDLLVVPDGRRIGAGPLRERSDLEVRHPLALAIPLPLNFKLLEQLGYGQAGVGTRSSDRRKQTMTITEAPPIACTLAPGAFKERIAWIGAVTRDALRSYERRDLVLDLRYAPQAAERVREIVRNEQTCCSFLTFDLREQPHEIQLIITAPESAREAADMLFEHFVMAAPPMTCGCTTGAAQSSSASKSPARKQVGTTAAGLTAMTLATGAVACGACCVLPLALPAVALASTGGILAWFGGAHAWVTALAIAAVLGAWGWIAWQTVQTRCRPALLTLYMMGTATGLLIAAVLWPALEPQLVRVLMG